MSGGRETARWYGKVRVAPWQWRQVALFTDKVASERELMRLQREADQRAAGVVTPEMEQAGRSLREHVREYVADLRRRNCSEAHVEICEKYLAIVLAETDWKMPGDVSAASFLQAVERLRTKREIGPSTINRYIARAKGLTRWMVEGRRVIADPLVSVKLGREDLGKRRGLTDREIAALQKAPKQRRQVYELLLLTGLRRGECESLCWGDVHAQAARPFLQLRSEETKNGHADQLELHPGLLGSLRKPKQASASDRVFDRVPSKAELLADLRACGVDPDKEGVGLVDLHSLRHTFDRLVIETGCTVKQAAALMRHRDPRMTMNVYAKLGVSDVQGVVGRVTLPYAPLMHQMAGVLGRCTADSGATMVQETGSAKERGNPLDQRVSSATARDRTRTCKPCGTSTSS